LARFLTRVGRMKLVLPVYQALVDAPAGQEFAAEVFKAARPGYHPITTAAVQKILSH
jgi:leukotriene-A4 hydrolase